jgi:Protein of unknown function (DUF1553)
MAQLEGQPLLRQELREPVLGLFDGTGIIGPLDDIGAVNPATSPELLDYLTKDFIENGLDLRHAMRLICKSRAHQLFGRDKQMERRRQG